MNSKGNKNTVDFEPITDEEFARITAKFDALIPPKRTGVSWFVLIAWISAILLSAAFWYVLWLIW